MCTRNPTAAKPIPYPRGTVWGDSAGIITIAAVGIAFVVSLAALFSTIGNHGHIEFPDHRWLTVGEFEFNVGILMDPLTAVMLVVVTGVSLMIQIYSVGYMSEEDNRGYSRYFAYMSLFTASMVGLVLASSVIQVFVFWELVGLCSYLLIGFWYNRHSAANAAKKAFIVTRGRRLRIPARDPVPVLQSERAGGGGTQRTGHRGTFTRRSRWD